MDELKEAIIVELKCNQYGAYLVEFWFHSQDYAVLNECISTLIRANLYSIDIALMNDEEMVAFIKHESLGMTESQQINLAVSWLKHNVEQRVPKFDALLEEYGLEKIGTEVLTQVMNIAEWKKHSTLTYNVTKHVDRQKELLDEDRFNSMLLACW